MLTETFLLCSLPISLLNYSLHLAFHFLLSPPLFLFPPLHAKFLLKIGGPLNAYLMLFSVPFKLFGTTSDRLPCNMASGIPWAQYSSCIESKYKFEYKYGLRSNLRAPQISSKKTDASTYSVATRTVGNCYKTKFSKELMSVICVLIIPPPHMPTEDSACVLQPLL